MKHLGLVFLFLLLAGASGQAAAEKVSWKSFGNAVKKDCEAFAAIVEASPINKSADSAKKRYPPRYPNRERLLPYVCIGLMFDIDSSGKTDNIEVVFKSPADVGEGFERAAINAVRKWRYRKPTNAEQRISGATTLISFEVR